MLSNVPKRLRNLRFFAASQWQESTGDLLDNKWWKYLLVALGGVLLLWMLIGIYWSGEPRLLTLEELSEPQQPAEASQPPVTGATTTLALIKVADTLLNKPGGYLSNDLAPPGVWLDNLPSWEYGALTQMRDLTRAMREAFSRSQSQSSEDAALKKAEAQFNFDNTSWILPSTEEEYRRGILALRDYLVRLEDENQQQAQFYARSDNLRYWLSTVETRLGSLSQNLSASVGQKRLNTDLAGDKSARQATRTPEEIEIKTPWSRVDNVFYEARGSAWALVHFLRAVEVDFADVLDDKNARVSLQQIIRELEGTQQPLGSPMVLNGDGFGVLANHSLVMANYISRANAALIDLRELLARG